jgi:hypothetical protein
LRLAILDILPVLSLTAGFSRVGKSGVMRQPFQRLACAAETVETVFSFSCLARG